MSTCCKKQQKAQQATDHVLLVLLSEFHAAEKYLCETKALILRANLMKHDLAQKNPQQGPQGGRRASATGFFGGLGGIGGIGGMGALQAFEAGMVP